jgi:D-amino-acid dehydrogenase
VERVVVAAGVWSRALARMLGTAVPLEAERGYHAMVHGSDVGMSTAVLSVDRHVSVTPLDYGIRAGGAAEFAAPDAPPDRAALAMIRRQAEALVPGLATGHADGVTEWVGSRPSHPDSKPAIGRAPKQPNAYFAFGHDHLGLTMGSITGKLIGEIVSQRPPSVDLSPFAPDRF